MRTGVADLPLHGGAVPRWLFARMRALAREILRALALEFGPGGVLARLADPFWFQSLGCLLGFDWHSSGLTTATGAALRDALEQVGPELGLFAAGGKGRAARQTPRDIERWGRWLRGDGGELVRASRLVAKVDSCALQDGYQLYHHLILFTADGQWAVVQQGMNPEAGYARRYHWLSEGMDSFVCEPHRAVICPRRGRVLNLVAAESAPARQAVVELSREHPERLGRELALYLRLPRSDARLRRLERTMALAFERRPAGLEELLEVEGVGPKTVRALCLLAELLYGTPASTRDPARYSFAHGGKDGRPFPVDRELYDRTVEALRRAVEAARIGRAEKLAALRKLAALA